jgi:hypothetical protein
MVPLLRDLIGDDVSAFDYSDDRLRDVLVHAGVSVIMEVDFANTYTINVNRQDISPDPVTGTAEIAFQVLVTRKAAYIMLRGEYRRASDKALSVRDGPSSIDGRGIADHKKNLMSAAFSEYDKARIAYLTGNGMHGTGIVTPYNMGVVGGTSSTTVASPRREIYGNWS